LDSDHAGDLHNRRSHSGVIIYLQSAPIIWFSKKQTTIETSTHGAELVATRAAIELIEGLRYKLRMFGISINGPATVYCDNESVVNNATRPDSVLKKKHNSISYHKIQESVAAGIIVVYKYHHLKIHQTYSPRLYQGLQLHFMLVTCYFRFKIHDYFDCLFFDLCLSHFLCHSSRGVFFVVVVVYPNYLIVYYRSS